MCGWWIFVVTWLDAHIRTLMPPETMLPAVAQGAVGIECRAARADVVALISRISHAQTMTCLAAERAFLTVLDGSCRTPIAGLATLSNGRIHLRGEVLSLDGKIRHGDAIEGAPDDAALLGVTLGNRLRAAAGEALLNHG
jgi:hydroxymethylbilane synthase